jgi:AcrR family transcriptional regulator
MANDSPPPRPRRRRDASEATRLRLLEEAQRLFEQSGFEAPLRVLFRQADITPPTLYQLIGSKDDLIVEVVKKWCEDWLAWMDSVLNRSSTADDRLVALFKGLERWLAEREWRGSLAANAAATLNASHPVHAVIAEHRRQVRDRLRVLVTESGSVDPNVTARKLHVLLDGAMAGAWMEQGPAPVRAALETARSVVTEA